jgi:hypothetical protein
VAECRQLKGKASALNAKQLCTQLNAAAWQCCCWQDTTADGRSPVPCAILFACLVFALQRLVAAHKGEMARAEQRHEAEAARRLQAAAAAQEEALAAVRAQWAGERGAALEAERAAAREQIKDAQGRSVGGWVAGRLLAREGGQRYWAYSTREAHAARPAAIKRAQLASQPVLWLFATTALQQVPAIGLALRTGLLGVNVQV